MNERGGSLGSFDAYNNALVFSVERFELLHGIAGAGVFIEGQELEFDYTSFLQWETHHVNISLHLFQ